MHSQHFANLQHNSMDYPLLKQVVKKIQFSQATIGTKVGVSEVSISLVQFQHSP